MLTKKEIKFIKSLYLKKNRDKEKYFIIEGKRAVEEAFKYNKNTETVILTHEFVDKNSSFINQLNELKIHYETISSKEMNQISDVENSQGVIAKVKYFNYSIDELIQNNILKSNIVILDSISDPGNMGAIIRTASWFGITCIISVNNCVSIYNTKLLRSTMGSIFHIPVIELDNVGFVFDKLKQNNYKIFAADIEGDSYKDIKYPYKKAIIFGNEAHGISNNIKNYIDKKITILKNGKGESLNVSVSAGIVIAHIIN
jgi:TrmH family RNA methyltransferase